MIYMQGREGLLQTRAPTSKGPCKQGPLQARAPASKGPCMIYRQNAPYRYTGSPQRQEPMRTGPTENVPYTDKGTLQTRGPHIFRALYRQGGPKGGLTDKEFIQTKGLASTARDPYRRCVIPKDKGLLQTIRVLIDNQGPYRQLRAIQTRAGFIDTVQFIQTRGSYRQGPLQIRVPYKAEAPTNKGPPTDAVQFLQTRDPYIIYRQGCKGPHKQGTPTEQGALTVGVQFLQESGSYKQGTPT